MDGHSHHEQEKLVLQVSKKVVAYIRGVASTRGDETMEQGVGLT